MRVLLVLGRVSNLPTVWSNCLAAWLLAGGGSWGRFCLVCLGATLLYTGGMFLNDAVDVEFDRRHRPERPIVSGQISARTVWALSCALLLAGWVIFLFLGNAAAIVAAFLVVTIVSYDLVHKHTVLAPLLMASCRFLLYPLAAATVNSAGEISMLWHAAGLASYIIGLSYLARVESTGARFLRWTVVLLFVPALIALLLPPPERSRLWLILPLHCAWTIWCLAPRRPGWLAFAPQGVAGLLAGIVLVDLVAAAGQGFAEAFLCLFFLAVLTQRIAPAT